jgi:hypothetical protein
LFINPRSGDGKAARARLAERNPYALDRPLARGTRPTLGGEQLGIVVVDAPGDSPLAPGRAWSAPRLEAGARNWPSGYRNSPEMRLTEPATMTTPNT